MILTTSPTIKEKPGDPVKRERNITIVSPPPSIKKDNSDATDLNGVQGVEGRHTPHDSVSSNLAPTRTSAETSGRLSTVSHSISGRHSGGTHHGGSLDVRFSESSRSDQSLGNEGELAGREESLFSKFMRFPRLKMSISGLGPKTRQSPAGKKPDGEDGSPPKQPSAQPAARSITSDAFESDQISPLPSPPRSSTRPSSPAHVAPNVRRHDSTNSAPSVRSLGSNGNLNAGKSRDRASTLNSLPDFRDNGYPQVPPNPTNSGRTSTSTTSGRKSFGDLLGIPHRLRQNSEPPIPRVGSPGASGATSPTPTVDSFSPPRRSENDSPDSYIARLREICPRGMMASVLSQSKDEFFVTALRNYMKEFSYYGDPIDMAIRKLLMEITLPKETQQIDRVLQNFADRYHECNPGIFASSEQAYFIVFSILILHTDVFNKNNKRKMQKPDYVKNTRGESVSEDILEYIYDNISYTPFIHIEDTVGNGRYLARPTRRNLFRTPSAENLSRAAREPMDPYALIMEGKLDILKPSLKEVMSLEDTYNCTSPSGPADMKALHEAFAKSGVLQILSPRSRPDAFMSPTSIDNPADSQPGLVDIRVAKVGVLWRKEPKKRRTRSPWQEWGAVLTFSQLYFFRDVNWVRSLVSQRDSQQRDGRRRTVLFRPFLAEFKPDAAVSTYDAVALLDSSYKKHKHAFVFVRHSSLEEVFLANDDADMEDWLAKLNYAAAFRSTGVRPRGMMATNYEAQKNRTSTAGPVILEDPSTSVSGEPLSPNIDAVISGDLPVASRHFMLEKVHEADEKLSTCNTQLEDLLRNATHLQILTPLHPRTREHVIMSAGRMAAKVKWVRQDIWRIKCYRSMLLQDLGEQTDYPLSDDAGLGIGEPKRVSAGELHETQSFETAPPFPDDSSPDEHHLSDETPSEKDTTVFAPADDTRRTSIPVSMASSDFSRSGRKILADGTKERSNSAEHTGNNLEREPSYFSGLDVSSLPSTSKLTSRGSVDDNEERVLRHAGISEMKRTPSMQSQFVDAETGLKSDEQLTPAAVQSKRRSLHRTLRNPQPSPNASIQNRITKRRNSTPNAKLHEDEDDQHDASLPRKAPSFVVHGKKASIVTFGSEWQNMPPEERLKLRKPTPSDGPRSSNPSLVGGTGSTSPERRASATSKWSFPQHEEMLEAKTRKSLDDLKQEPNEHEQYVFTDAPERPNSSGFSFKDSEKDISVSDDAAPTTTDLTGTSVEQEHANGKMEAHSAGQAVMA